MNGVWILPPDAMVPGPSGGGNGTPPMRPHPLVLAPGALPR